MKRKQTFFIKEKNTKDFEAKNKYPIVEEYWEKKF